LTSLERVKITDSSSTNAIKSYVDGVELISPRAKKIIDEQKKLMPALSKILIIKEEIHLVMVVIIIIFKQLFN
jgi:hypothetical protein